MSLQSAIRKARRSLRWAVVHAQGRTADILCTSEVETRRHVITFPAAGDAVRDIEYLHELAHAWLAENIHPLLCTGIFALGTPGEHLQLVRIPKQVAADWFADGLLMKWAPDAEWAEIAEHVGYIPDVPPDPGRLYGGALILAQGVYWLNRPLKSTPPVYRPVIADFLRVDPIKPSLGRMQFLVNALLAHTAPLRILHIIEDGFDVWRIRED